MNIPVNGLQGIDSSLNRISPNLYRSVKNPMQRLVKHIEEEDEVAKFRCLPFVDLILSPQAIDQMHWGIRTVLSLCSYLT